MQDIALNYSPMTASACPPASPADGPGWTGATKRVWIMLVAEGGFWSALEIRAKLLLPAGINSILRDMQEAGCILQRKRHTIDGETLVEYGVVRKCKVPRGVTWEEIEALRQPVLQ